MKIIIWLLGVFMGMIGCTTLFAWLEDEDPGIISRIFKEVYGYDE